MVGSNLGWVTAPYVDCPAGMSDFAGSLARAAEDVWIVPGARHAGFNRRGDVMRGEETQLFGWLSLNPRYETGRWLVCHPGTHTKWMVIEDGRLTAFATTMTGEIFAVMSRHSVLRTDPSPDDPAAFDEGLEAAGDGTALAARLFTARARVVGMAAPPESTSGYLSGLLIGADVAATPGLLEASADGGVVLIGDPKLCGLYARALERRGMRPMSFDGEAAAVAGLWALRPRGIAS
jgi:2-dehydro-3-deoxygalactonokinase